MIPFKKIPNNLRVPLFYAEVDNSQANTSQGTLRTLIIGQITSAGAAVAGVPVLSQGVADAIALGGPGSMLHLMVRAYRAADNFGEVWLLPLADNGSAVAAAGSINFTAPASANGTLSLYIAGQGVPVPIATTQTANNIATAVAAAINANVNLPVTATVDGSTLSKVNLLAKNAGAKGNDIDIRFNYYGSPNEITPTGLTYTIVPMASGATNPTLSTALASLATQSYDFIVQPYNDTPNTTAMTAYLNDTTGTWSWDEQLYGHAFGSYKGTFSQQVTFGNALNDQHTSIFGFFDSPTTSWEIAADFAATCAVALRADPARPLAGLTLSTMLAPPLASRFPISELNTLLFDGITPFKVNDDGSIALSRVITTYQKNGFGIADNSYLDITTLFNLASVIRQLAAVVTSRYSNVKLAADGTKFAAGSAVVTPATIRADLIAEYQQLEFNGQVQESAKFAAGLIVQQNANDPNRVDVLWDGILIDQLAVFALLAQFRLT